MLPFASPLLLLWALAAAIPIAIHLLTRWHYQTERWAAMEYLLAAMKRRAWRMQFQQWLLLAIRVLMMLLFAVALAEPYLSELPAFTGASGRTHWVIVIDNSYSMDYREQGTARLEKAKEQALELVAGSETGDGYSLITLAGPPQTIIGSPAYDKADLRKEIANLNLDPAAADLEQTLAEIENVIREEKEQGSRLSRWQVCILSDMQYETWKAATTNGFKKSLKDLQRAADGQLNLFLQPVGETSASPGVNAAVTEVTLDRSVVTTDQIVKITATIANWSPEDRPGSRASLWVNDQQVESRTVLIPAGGTATVSFPYRFIVANQHKVEVRLAADRLPLDDRRYLSVPVRESIRVLCIAGKAKSADPLSFALQPDSARWPRVSPVVKLETAILEDDLSSYDAIFICNLESVTVDQAGALAAYLGTGGGIVWFLGDQVNAEKYNAELLEMESDRGESKTRLLPAGIGKVLSTEATGIDPLDYRHPIAQPFEANQNTGLLTSPIWRYRELLPIEGSSAESALGVVGGQVLVMTEKLAGGQVVLVATSASAESVDATADPPQPWNVLHTWPSYLPLVHEMLSVASSQRDASRNVLVGEDIKGYADETTGASGVTLIDPSGTRNRIQLSAESGLSSWQWDDPRQVGFYTLDTGSEMVEQNAVFAVNLNTTESNLVPADSDQQNEIQNAFNDVSTERQSTSAGQITANSAEAGRWKVLIRCILLGTVLILLLADITLARYFSRPAIA
jgi:hypothetical protein